MREVLDTLNSHGSMSQKGIDKDDNVKQTMSRERYAYVFIFS